MPVQVTYEILYKVPFSDPVRHESHCSGRPDIRTTTQQSIEDFHKHHCDSHLYLHPIREVKEISQEEYDSYMEGQRIMGEAINRNFRAGVE
jgi:hypothetical protein